MTAARRACAAAFRAIRPMIDASTRALAGKRVVVLPDQAGDEESLLTLETHYRVNGNGLRTLIREPRSGRLTCTLIGYDGHFARRNVWRSGSVAYDGPSAFTFDVATGVMTLNGLELGRVNPTLIERRFCWMFELVQPTGTKRRLTGHYRANSGGVADENYYRGDHYIDYELEAAGEPARVVDLMHEHRAASPVLEIGCATGRLVSALIDAGFDAYGVDGSKWAINAARRRVPSNRVAQCVVGEQDLPPEIAGRAPFGTIVLWAVLEHFANPFDVLEILTALSSPDALLLINTSNVDSLTRQLFRSEWEGYVDWTHQGVDQVSARRLRSMLPSLGWQILALTTDGVWTKDADPTAATLREWWACDARFRALLQERDLGDFVTCVARRAAA